MFCPNCGSNTDDGSNFCKQCGKPLHNAAPAPGQKESGANTMTNQASVVIPARPSGEPVLNIPEEKFVKDKGGGCFNWFVAVGAGVLLGAVFAFGTAFLVHILPRDFFKTFSSDDQTMMKIGVGIICLMAFQLAFMMVRKKAGGLVSTKKKIDFPVLTSGTSKCRSPKDVFKEILLLYEKHGGEFVTFQLKGSGLFVQVTAEQSIAFNFSYPYNDQPQNRLNQLGIGFPPGFGFSNMEAGTYAMYEGPLVSKTEIIELADTFFTKLYGQKKNYIVEGFIE